jgi:threonine synthase
VTDAPRLRCHGCGTEVADKPYPFRCPRADSGDDADHVLEPAVAPGEESFADHGASQPFVRYRASLYSHALARSRGMSDADFVRLVHELDAAVAAVAGRGFRATPCAPAPTLAARLGMAGGEVWVKDETGNVAGSHKARHLFGIALALEVAERTGLARRAETDRRGLAIASCGNAALAAAVIARATRRPLRVFIPPDAHPLVTAELGRLGAAIAVCERVPGSAGDPCLRAFHDVVRDGALPFCCQGSENGLAIEGGMTLAWEMAEVLTAAGARLDRLFVQVGGGALASACVQGLERARARDRAPAPPRLHAVQTTGGWPLRRAYQRLRERVLGVVTDGDAAAAERLRDPSRAAAVAEAFEFVRTHRSRFMWPWETIPHSMAHGILDDETYDWYRVGLGMVEHGGWPIVVSESRLGEARTLAADTLAAHADATGTAGLAGLIELRCGGDVAPDERVAVLLTGAAR